MDLPHVIEALKLGLLGELVLAALLGGAIGLEREVNGKPAGFRTNLLICVGAALLTQVSREVALSAEVMGGVVRGDPARIAAQVVSGIGFLGAGTIMQARGSVVGLTTAATLWVVAAIGIAVGAHEFMAAVGTTVLVLAALLLLGRVEHQIVRRRATHTLRVILEPDVALVAQLGTGLTARGFRVRTEDVEWEQDELRVTMELSGRPGAAEEAVDLLLRASGVRRVSVV